MTTEQKIRQHIYTYSKKISNEVGEELNMKFEPNALDLIAEMTYTKLGLYGADLEAFQKHARRSTVTMDDVKLLVRRNESLAFCLLLLEPYSGNFILKDQYPEEVNKKKMVNEKAQFLLDNKPPDAAPPVKRKRKTTNSTS